MDLKTHYLGFELEHPLIPGASPLADDHDSIRRLEDAGAPAIVMRSLFEEQIALEQLAHHHHLESTGESFAEALSYQPEAEPFELGPEEYLEQIARIKSAISVPLVASLNGTTKGGWLDYSKLIEQAGADALELNLYDLATDFELSSSDLEHRQLEMVSAVRDAVELPLAVKLSPFYTTFAHFAAETDRSGADALVLFNRFYQPDIDVEELEVESTLRLSDSSELNLRLRWLAILFGRVSASLAVTGGVHQPIDAIKATMCGASAVQVVSALLEKGPSQLLELRKGIELWLEEHEYDSLAQARGSMSLTRCPDPHAFERANYIQLLQSWRSPSLL